MCSMHAHSLASPVAGHFTFPYPLSKAWYYCRCSARGLPSGSGNDQQAVSTRARARRGEAEAPQTPQ